MAFANGDPSGARRREILAAVGVFGVQAIAVAVWLGSEHAARVAADERITRVEQMVERLDTRGGRQLGIVTDQQQQLRKQVPDLYEKLYSLQLEVALMKAARPR